MGTKPSSPETPESGQAPYIVARDTAAEDRRAYAADMKYYEDHPIDECKVPGGYFLNSDGSGAHDSEGNPVAVLPEDEQAVAELRAQAEKRQTAPAPAPVIEDLVDEDG